MEVEHRQLRQQRLLDQLAEGADDPDLRCLSRDRGTRLVPVDALGLVQLDTELGRGRSHRRRRRSPTASAPAIGRGDRQARTMRGRGKRTQHGGGELRRPEVDDGTGRGPAALTSRPRRRRSARRRRRAPGRGRAWSDRSSHRRAGPAWPRVAARARCDRG